MSISNFYRAGGQFQAAAPAGGIEFVGSVTYASNISSTSLDLTALTGGIGSAAIEDDVVIVYYGASSNTNRIPTVTTAGYTTIGYTFVNDTNDALLGVHYKVMGSTPDTTVDLGSSSSSSGTGWCAVVLVFRGVDAAVLDAGFNARSSGNTRIPVLAPHNANTTGAVIVSGAVSAHAGGNLALSGTSLANSIAVNHDATNDCSLLVGWDDWSGSFFDEETLTISGDSTNDSYASYTLALRPSGGSLPSPAYGMAISVNLGAGAVTSTTAVIGTIHDGYDNWRQHSGSPNFTIASLQNNAGVSTGTGLTVTNASANVNTLNTEVTPEGLMFERALRVNTSATATTLDFTAIPYAKYDIVAYIDESSGSGTSTLQISDGTTTYYADADGATQWNGTYQRITATSGSGDLVGNYMHWEGLTAANTTLTASAGSALEWGICGIQIIERLD